jgi:hypothetical protein
MEYSFRLTAFNSRCLNNPFYHSNANFGDGQNQTVNDLFYLTCTGGKDNNKNKEERYFNIIKVDKSSLSLDVNTKTNNQL